jgi:hypothetical protein
MMPTTLILIDPSTIAHSLGRLTEDDTTTVEIENIDIFDVDIESANVAGTASGYTLTLPGPLPFTIASDGVEDIVMQLGFSGSPSQSNTLSVGLEDCDDDFVLTFDATRPVRNTIFPRRTGMPIPVTSSKSTTRATVTLIRTPANPSSILDAKLKMATSAASVTSPSPYSQAKYINYGGLLSTSISEAVE